MNVIDKLIQQVQSRYNSDFDICPNGPNVRWAEFTLTEIVKAQQAQIDMLKAQVERLESRIGPVGVDESDSVNAANRRSVKQIAEVTVFSGNSLKVARVKKARSILPLGLIEAKKFVEANFADNGRGKVIVRN